jgi:hypothetical protein
VRKHAARSERLVLAIAPPNHQQGPERGLLLASPPLFERVLVAPAARVR